MVSFSISALHMLSVCTLLVTLSSTSSFVIVPNIHQQHQHVVVPSYSRRSTTNANSKLCAIAIPPAEQDNTNEEINKEEEDDQIDNEWTITRGGFIPNILKRRSSRQKEKQKRRSNIQHVDNIHDYKEVVVEEREKIVVVRFVADWCRSCKAMKPVFNKLVTKMPSSEVKFVEVPLTKDTEYLLNGLGVPSVPFAHVYHPSVGLVEEMKISKPHFAEFSKKLNSYVVGTCNLSDWVKEEGPDEEEAMGSFQ